MKISDFKFKNIGKLVKVPSFDAIGNIKMFKITKYQFSVIIVFSEPINWHNQKFEKMEFYKDIDTDQLKQIEIL
jgi:hypothetical protein